MEIKTSFENSMDHVITLMKKPNKRFFLRENDIQCFLYRDLCNKFKGHENLWPSFRGERLFPLHTEYQYKVLNPEPKSLGGEAIDLVVLSKNKKAGIKIALEIKFSTPVLKSNTKSSAGNKLLDKDIQKLKELHADYKYFLYFKEGGDCFLTSNYKRDALRRKQFFEPFHKSSRLKNLTMYYVEKEDESQSLHRFLLYTIDRKNFNPIRLSSKKQLKTKKHLKVFIYSDSKNTRRRAEKASW